MRKNAFWTQLGDFRQLGFLHCLEKATQNGGIKPTSWNLIPRVFIRFAPMGKVEKTRFERNWTTFVNTAFCAACKSKPQMVVWNRPRGIRSQGCFFVSPRCSGPARHLWDLPPSQCEIAEVNCCRPFRPAVALVALARPAGKLEPPNLACAWPGHRSRCNRGPFPRVSSWAGAAPTRSTAKSVWNGQSELL